MRVRGYLAASGAYLNAGALALEQRADPDAVWLPLSNSDLTHCFEQAAKRDWSTALAAAQSLESKALKDAGLHRRLSQRSLRSDLLTYSHSRNFCKQFTPCVSPQIDR